MREGLAFHLHGHEFCSSSSWSTFHCSFRAKVPLAARKWGHVCGARRLHARPLGRTNGPCGRRRRHTQSVAALSSSLPGYFQLHCIARALHTLHSACGHKGLARKCSRLRRDVSAEWTAECGPPTGWLESTGQQTLAQRVCMGAEQEIGPLNE